MTSSSHPVAPLRGFPFAMVASTTLWLLALIVLALLFRMEGKSLRHSVQRRAHSVVVKVRAKVPHYRAMIGVPPVRHDPPPQQQR